MRMDKLIEIFNLLEKEHSEEQYDTTVDEREEHMEYIEHVDYIEEQFRSLKPVLDIMASLIRIKDDE